MYKYVVITNRTNFLPVKLNLSINKKMSETSIFNSFACGLFTEVVVYEFKIIHLTIDPISSWSTPRVILIKYFWSCFYFGNIINLIAANFIASIEWSTHFIKCPWAEGI